MIKHCDRSETKGVHLSERPARLLTELVVCAKRAQCSTEEDFARRHDEWRVLDGTAQQNGELSIRQHQCSCTRHEEKGKYVCVGVCALCVFVMCVCVERTLWRRETHLVTPK